MKKSKKANPENSLLTKEGDIRADMPIAEVVARFPETMPVFFKHGMSCFGCPMALQETVGQGAEVHGIEPKKMLEELNKARKKKR